MATSLLYRVAQRTLLLDVTHLLVSTKELPFAPGQFDFRELTSEDIIRLAENSSLELDASMASRLDFGLDHCFGAFDGEDLAGYCWIARQNIEPENNRGAHPQTGVAISFASDTAFIYKAFTHPQSRGQQVFSRVLGFAADELQRCGVVRFLSTTDWINHSALRAFERSGFESVGKVWQVARISSMTVGPAKARAMGIRIGSAAKFTRRE